MPLLLELSTTLFPGNLEVQKKNPKKKNPMIFFSLSLATHFCADPLPTPTNADSSGLRLSNAIISLNNDIHMNEIQFGLEYVG